MDAARSSLTRLPAVDIVVIDSLEVWKTTAVLCRRRRPRTVALVHQHPGGVDGPRCIRAPRRRLDLAAYRRCDLIVATGPAVADVLGRLTPDSTRVEVIPPGSDLPSFDRRPPLRTDRRIGVLNVANWMPNKGIVELVDAVSSLPQEDVIVHVAGETDGDAEYRALVRAHLRRVELAGRVIVHGAVEPSTVASLYAAADVFVFPSYTEAYGGVVAEALAMGLPVVGWRTPHMCALVDDHVEGLLVRPGDVAGLRAAIHRLAVDDALLATLSDGARRRGVRLPTWEQTARRFFGALRRLVTEPVEPTQHRTPTDNIDPTD
jgi:glycosyltransferase involved in cell wall biosynthesis